jgi:alpha-ketoglutarate-dependent taurine dioxygenase
LGVYDKRNPGKEVYFGDNTRLPEDVQVATYQFMLDNSVVHQWEKGNFMYIDNTVTYHSRLPFKGKRLIYAAVANGTKPLTFT